MSKSDRGPDYGDSLRPVDTEPSPVERRLIGWGRGINEELAHLEADQKTFRNELDASMKRVEALRAELADIEQHLSKMGVQPPWADPSSSKD